MRGNFNFEIQQIFDTYQFLSIEELTILSEDKRLPAWRAAIARALLKIAISGNPKEIETIKNIAGGPEVKQVELSGRDGAPLNPLAEKSPDELVATWNELQRQMKERETNPPPVIDAT